MCVTESVFNLLKLKWLSGKVHRSRDEARQDMFDYIEMFCTPTRKYVKNGMLSPAATGQVYRDAGEIWKRGAPSRVTD
ncbi:IS3 family transposase [Agrobacterium tumefaciens]|nr:IS3 family transposase [Agrobacterium tumefaciens]